MADNDPIEHELDRFWNDLVRQSGDGRDAQSVDESLIVRLHHVLGAPQPVASRQRVIDALTRELEPREPEVSRNGHGRDPAMRHGLTVTGADRRRTPTPSPPRLVPVIGRVMNYAAIAALLLATGFGLGYLAFRNLDDHRSFASSDAEPSGGSESSGLAEWTTLIDVMLPPALIATDTVESSLTYAVFPAGMRATWFPSDAIQLRYVTSGRIVITSSERIQVLRAGSREDWDVPAAGEAIELAAGDAMIMTAQGRVRFTNNDTSPATILSLTLADNPDQARFTPAGWQIRDRDEKDLDVAGAPERGVRVQLRSFSLPGGVNVTLAESDLPQLIVNAPSDDFGTPVSASAAMIVGDRITISPNFDTTAFVAYVTAD